MNNQISMIADRHLYLGEGIACIEARCTLYQNGPGSFELYYQVGGEVPHRFQGTLSACINYGQTFCDARKREGYLEDMPAAYPAIPGDTLSIG